MDWEARRNFSLKEESELSQRLVGCDNDKEIDKVQIQMIQKLQEDKWTADTIELLNVQLNLNPYKPYLKIFGRDFKHDYLKKEHDWYMSESLSIKGYMDDIKIWNFCASKDGNGEINSNYGNLVFSGANHNQYDYCLNRLKFDMNTREAMIIYTRPSIQHECSEKGKHDFICTNYAHFFIRDNQLLMTVSQRSCDIVTGLSFDFPWHCLIYQMMYEELKETYPDLDIGPITYNIDSLHFYKRSLNLVEKYIDSLPKIGVL